MKSVDYDYCPVPGDRVVLGYLYDYYKNSSMIFRCFPDYVKGTVGTIIKRVEIKRKGYSCECEFKVLWDGKTEEEQYPASFFNRAEE